MRGRCWKCILESLHQTTPGAPAVTASQKTAAKRRLLSRDERRATIIHGAAEAFARSGYAATSMEDVAAASGITKLIVYRNFESKEVLYRAVLESVSGRLVETYVDYMQQGRQPAGTRSLLTVAREEPAGFVLLWVHATREPQFADYSAGHRDMAVEATRKLLTERVSDPVVRAWAAEALVDWSVQSVLRWLDHGTPARDAEFLATSQRTIAAMIATWAPGT
jgi:AcrR family transcriptional regulator